MSKKYVMIHCSASDDPLADNIETMRQWHLARGWRDVGYHYFIRKDGTIEKGRDELDDGAHCVYDLLGKSMNRTSISICLHGLEHDRFTKEQFESCAFVIRGLMKRHKIGAIVPHSMFHSSKTCPVFNIVEEIYPRLYEARFEK